MPKLLKDDAADDVLDAIRDLHDPQINKTPPLTGSMSRGRADLPGCSDGSCQSKIDHPGRQFRFSIQRALPERAAQQLEDVRCLHMPAQCAQQPVGLDGPPQ